MVLPMGESSEQEAGENDCRHVYVHSSPRGTRLGIGICLFCHMPDANDLAYFEHLEDDWQELDERLVSAGKMLQELRDQPVSIDRSEHLKSKAEGVRLSRSYLEEIRRRRRQRG